MGLKSGPDNHLVTLIKCVTGHFVRNLTKIKKVKKIFEGTFRNPNFNGNSKIRISRSRAKKADFNSL